jgi:hypothetical protein
VQVRPHIKHSHTRVVFHPPSGLFHGYVWKRSGPGTNTEQVSQSKSRVDYKKEKERCKQAANGLNKSAWH